MDTQTSEFSVTQGEGRLVVQGPIAFDADSHWSALALDDKRILLIADESKVRTGTKPTGMASCPIEVFKDFLLGLHRAAWSGIVSVDTGYGYKKVYLNRGELVFAGSNVVDDRLGEVIYREARLSLDQL